MTYPDNSWVSPSGDVFECGLYEHVARAYDICEKLNIEVDFDDEADDILIKMGYMKLQQWSSGKCQLPINWDKITKVQQKIIDLWIEERF